MRLLPLLALLPGLALGATQTITENTGGDFTGVEDTRIAESSATTNFSGSINLETSTFGASADRTNTVIKFDLSNLPASITITDAKLRLKKNGSDAVAGDDDISVYRLLRTVVFNQATYNVYSTGNSWQTAGGSGALDIDTTATDTIAVNDTTGVYVEWDVTADVQDFYAGTETNNGWLLSSDTYTQGDWKQYHSSDATDTNRPELVVTYIIPPVYSVAPACASVTADTATCSATATDTDTPIDHYMGVYTDGSTPTAAQVKAGTGTGFVANTADSDLNVASGVAASLTSGANLAASTAYDVWFVAEDNVGDLQVSPTKVDITTSAGGATLSLDDATPEAGATVVGTLSQALAGGNPTKVVFGSGDEVTCDSATATSCTFTLTLSQFSNLGTLNNTQWGVAGTVKASDGTNETSTTPITIGVPAAGSMVNLACTAGTNCDAGSEAVSPMTTNDDCAVVVNSGSALSSLTTHCQPLFAGPSSNYTVYQFDESATAWLEQNSGSVSPPPSSCNHGVVQSVVNDVVQDTIEAPICE